MAVRILEKERMLYGRMIRVWRYTVSYACGHSVTLVGGSAQAPDETPKPWACAACEAQSGAWDSGKTYEDYIAYRQRWYGTTPSREEYEAYVIEERKAQEAIDRADAYYSRRLGF